ncbi:hypothetical protein NEOLEDRAFT_32502 [Neolentinus lepideus HHB14362 ss-1]|uniref:Uncharacterized protein n=1 Tax=Neolentinus lepideus HHB14362 ss-1 TaxID=1314782 RepID=A0A165W6G3_9AGAM|nr:hypothetical protein NEOLEDRAFT_32502 [Neolentinus lepideus HHB14362 ss-1]
MCGNGRSPPSEGANQCPFSTVEWEPFWQASRHTWAVYFSEKTRGHIRRVLDGIMLLAIDCDTYNPNTVFPAIHAPFTPRRCASSHIASLILHPLALCFPQRSAILGPLGYHVFTQRSIVETRPKPSWLAAHLGQAEARAKPLLSQLPLSRFLQSRVCSPIARPRTGPSAAASACRVDRRLPACLLRRSLPQVRRRSSSQGFPPP